MIEYGFERGWRSRAHVRFAQSFIRISKDIVSGVTSRQPLVDWQGNGIISSIDVPSARVRAVQQG